ncbi:MAG: c-type cytochrome domain-containing protein [Pirellulaceae bacterium]|nr:c-type cytochrome domain-containing protein [Pirellulaceae bacterium]
MVLICLGYRLARVVVLCIAMLSLHTIFLQPCSAQNTMTAEQITQAIRTAGQEYRAGKIDEAVALLNRSTAQLQKLVREVDNPRALVTLKTLHGGLTKAYQRLELDGVSLDPLPDWTAMVEAAKKKPSAPNNPNAPMAADGKIAFDTDIAPWMISKCSRCHINDAKGGFSMKSMADLMKGSKGGVVVFPKDAASSRLIEVIESGDMPRGGNKVTPAELDKLKKWINQGCLFDPQKATASLTSLAGGAPGVPKMNARDMATSVRKPTGKETVSFSKDVAPILLANCKGCHIDARQQGGQLDMDTFTRLLRGGENGEIVEAGKSDNSMLIKKLKGTAPSGARMPAGGKAALKPEEIQLIAKWIDEGTAFDGHSAEANIESVASQAWAASASYEELMKRRQERALQKWSVAFPKEKPDQAMEGEFVVLGNIGQRGVDEILASSKAAMEKMNKAVKAQGQDSLAKGGVTIFAIKSRYDYSEFGKMAESRSLPSQWTGHWRREVLDVYVAILYDKDPKANEANLTQQLASLWVSANKGTPSWFSNGFGRGIFSMLTVRNDARVKAWDQKIPKIIGGMKSPEELLDGKMNEEDAAIIGYGLVRMMIDSPGRKTLDQFLRSLDKTEDFDLSFTQTIGPLEPAVGAILHLPSNKKK